MITTWLKPSALWAAVACSVVFAACSTTDKDSDARATDGTAVSEAGLKLWPCTNPGKSCNAHDPCAINPVCGTDGLCRPEAIQNCDDGLECTEDTCDGPGLCKNSPKPQACVLLLKNEAGKNELTCFKEQDRNPKDTCLICDPAQSKFKWSSANGGACDDNDACTKDDYCQNGRCNGTFYGEQCADGFDCTDDLCDGKGGCLGSTVRTDSCLVNGTCFADGQRSTDGCSICDAKTAQNLLGPISNSCTIKEKCYVAGEMDFTQCKTCDPTKSTTDWSPIAGLCEIAGKCYKQGDKDFTGCGECDAAVNPKEWTVKGDSCVVNGNCYKPGDLNLNQCGSCDPTKSKTAFTPLTGKCEIDTKCYAAQDKHVTGCFVCDPTKDTKGWSAIANLQTTNYGFEDAKFPAGWKVVNGDAKVGWFITTRRALPGSYSLYYGNPATGSFDSGATNKGTVSTGQFALTAGKKAALKFRVYIDTEAGQTFDAMNISVMEGTVKKTVWQKTYSSPLKTWTDVVVDLSAYVGKSISLDITFDSFDDQDNSGEGVYIDDITLYSNC